MWPFVKGVCYIREKLLKLKFCNITYYLFYYQYFIHICRKTNNDGYICILYCEIIGS